MYKVVIPSAGIGSRIGTYTKFMNKALVSVKHRPAICHIIDSFPGADEIIVLTGYRGDHLEQVLRAFYPGNRVRFLRVDKYEGPGSGLGYTLKTAESLLQCPFIFVSNDTLVLHDVIDRDPNIYGNWMGYVTRPHEDNLQYRTLNVSNNHVHSINPKGALSPHVYIGLCGVKDYRKFWSTMDAGGAEIEVGESYGLKGVPNIEALEIKSWCDIGNLPALERTRRAFSQDDSQYNILEKEDECIWFKDDLVYKFSVDENFIRDRVLRRELLSDALFPRIIYSDKNIYVYERAAGEVFSKNFTPSRMWQVLDHMQRELWSIRRADLLMPSCIKFYRNKTYERVSAYQQKYEVRDAPAVINDVRVDTVASELSLIDWESLQKNAIFADFHGDFHNENILIREGGITLLDWRQNFAGELHAGDVYYDLAKFYHGLLVSHDVVHREGYSVKECGEEQYHISILRPSELVDGSEAFKTWCASNNYDFERVELLTALIFLNIAALHEWPYSKYLYLLGRLLLHKYNSNKNIKF